MARSSSAAAASGSFMGSAALKPANRSGWLRTSSAISSLAARARSRATAGPAELRERRHGERQHLDVVTEEVHHPPAGVQADQRRVLVEPRLEAEDPVAGSCARHEWLQARGVRGRENVSEGVDLPHVPSSRRWPVRMPGSYGRKRLTVKGPARRAGLPITVVIMELLSGQRQLAHDHEAGIGTRQAGTTRTGSDFRPLVKFDRIRRRRPASSNLATRRASAASTIFTSRRARCAPRHRCGPPRPKLR